MVFLLGLSRVTAQLKVSKDVFCVLIIRSMICISMAKITLRSVFLPLLALSSLLYLYVFPPATYPQHVKVDVIKDAIIVYNRVPKCGSTLFVTLLRRVSKNLRRFKIVGSWDFYHVRFTEEEQKKLARRLLTHSENAEGRPVLYHRHVHFFNMSLEETTSVLYINQIRDPLEHALSTYESKRFKCLVKHFTGLCEMLDPSVRKLTLNECISTGDPARCVTRPYGISSILSFFCGQAEVCDDKLQQPSSHAALALAKSNIERFYIYVGILGYMETSLELLEYIHPRLFAGIADIYRTGLTRKRVGVTPKKYRHEISNQTRTTLIRLLQPEYELYNFVRQRLFDQYRRAFGRNP